METTKEITTQTVKPLTLSAARTAAIDGLEIRPPNTKLSLCVRASLQAIPVLLLGYFGIIQGGVVWSIFGSLATLVFLRGGIVRWRRAHHDVYRMIAALPGSAYGFLQENEKRISELAHRCFDLDERLAAFVDGKSAFDDDMAEQYDAAMAQFAEERETLLSEVTRYLAGLREAVATDRERLRFIDDCSSLAAIRERLNKRTEPVLSAKTRHIAQDIAGAVLTERLTIRRVELMMPHRLLELKAPLDRRYSPVPAVPAPATNNSGGPG